MAKRYMELYGKARGTSLTYPPTHLGAVALRRASAKASEGYPPAAESTEALMLWPMNVSTTTYAFIVRRHRLWPTASTGKTRYLLRRWIKNWEELERHLEVYIGRGR